MQANANAWSMQILKQNATAEDAMQKLQMQKLSM